MTITTIVPDQLINSTGLNVVGTASVLTALSDSSDSTYVVGITNNGTAHLNLQTFSISGVRVKRVRIRIRDAHDSAGGGLQTGYALLYDTQGPGQAAFNPLSRGATNVAEQAGPWSTSAPGGLAFTQGVLNRMAVQIAVQGDTAWLRIHDIKVDVDTNSAPVTSAVTANNFTSTTMPDASWTFTDADGDVQARYRVKVFTSTQFGAAGFNPETSASTFDSSDQFGDATGYTITKNLSNGASYRFYVKTAQDWAGPEGQLWWSAWANSSTFTVSVTPPPTPTLTATTDAVLPGYRALLTATAPINLATENQSSLEVDTSGWVALSNCTISRSTAYFVHGVASLQMSSTASGTMTAEWSTRPAVAGGGAYFAKATIRSATAARTVRVGIRWWDTTGALLSTSFGGTATSTTGTDTIPVVSATAPTNATTASVVLEVQSTAAAAEIHRWDKIGLWVGGDQVWSIGGNQGLATVSIERLLKVSSDRAVPGNWAHPQIASGGALTFGSDGFTSRQTSRISSRILDGPHPASTAGAGARMIVWHPLVGAFNALDFGLPNTGTTDDLAPPYLMPAVPGRAQTLSVYIKGSSAVNARIFVYPVDNTNTQVGVGTEVASATTALSTSAWTRYTTTITSPAGTCYLRGAVELPSGSQDLDVFVTGIQLELGSTASAFVPGTGEGFPAWETVRELESTAPVSPGEVYRAFDHEIPPGDPVLYRARTVIGTIASGYSTPLAVFMDPPSRNLLKDPFQPENAVIVNVDPSWSETQSTDSAIYHPLGRDEIANGTADPIQVRDWLGGQDGAYVLGVLTETDLYRLRNLISSNRPLLLQHFDGGQRYMLIVDDRSTARVGPGVYRVTVKTFTCARPT